MSIRKILKGAVLCFSLLYMVACHQDKVSYNLPDPTFVAAHSGPLISVMDPILITFTQPFVSTTRPSVDALVIQPATSGNLEWQDDYTLRFTPQSPLEAGKRYRVMVEPAKLQRSDHPSFMFEFETELPSFKVQLEPVRIDSEGNIQISGTIFTNFTGSQKKVERCLSSKGPGEYPMDIYKGSISICISSCGKNFQEYCSYHFLGW